MDNETKKAYFEIVNNRYKKCLEPEEECDKNPIRAHSIQNSVIFDQISFNGHVIMPLMKYDINGKPLINFEKIGRNQAATFSGLCSIHDARIFRPIEMMKLDISDPHHLFLLAYRAVLKESHACFQGACNIQSAYLLRIENGKSPKDRPDWAGMHAVAWLKNAYDLYLYKRKYDEVYINKDYSRLINTVITLENVPISVAVNTLFSLDDIEWPEDVSRITMNVFPFNGKVYVIFSFFAEEKRFTEQYLQKILYAEGDYQKYLISKMILQHCENFVLHPRYYESMDAEKKRALTEFFCNTILCNKHDFENKNLYLF